MGTRHVRIDEQLYERLQAHKQEDETFSETIDRLTEDYTLVDFANETVPAGTSNEELEALTSGMSPTVDEDDG
jgi:predicted CopG family antitoxin